MVTRAASLRVRMLCLALVGGTSALTLTVIGHRELTHVAAVEAEADVLESAVDTYQRLELARSRALVGLLLEQPGEVEVALSTYLDLASELASAPLPAEHTAGARATLVDARELANVAARYRPGQGTATVVASFTAVDEVERAADGALYKSAERVEDAAIEVRTDAQRNLVVAGSAAFAVMLTLALLLGTALVAQLRRIAAVASAVAAGDLSARVGARGRDEVGALGGAIDSMADTLAGMLDAQRRQAEQQDFSTRLGVALEHADDRAAVLAVAARAMDVIAAGPVELLLADSSQAHLVSATSSPSHGRPGCGVASPRACPAVRSGTALVTDDSGALDACPHLQARSATVGGAVCVPVTFMGRALGVLHATSEQPGPAGEATVRNLRSLAGQVSNRLGTVGVLAQAQLQAGTDALTGLSNRRTAEGTLHEMHTAGRPYGLMLCDLDHFKRINDTFGHEAGDRALRVFAAALPGALRDGDLAARWGGEEFLLILPTASVHHVRDAALRVQRALADALAHNACPSFTVSIGVTDSYSARTVDEQVAHADAALRQAKESGRDCVVIAGGSRDAVPTDPAGPGGPAAQDPVVVPAQAALNGSAVPASADAG